MFSNFFYNIRHQPQESEKAHEELHSIFGPHLMGKIALGIFQHHYNNEITYCLGKDAKDKYREIVEAYNDQFNLKWSSSQDGNEALDSDDRADICTRSKAPTLIGRLSIILWIYINGKFYLINLRDNFINRNIYTFYFEINFYNFSI